MRLKGPPSANGMELRRRKTGSQPSAAVSAAPAETPTYKAQPPTATLRLTGPRLTKVGAPRPVVPVAHKQPVIAKMGVPLVIQPSRRLPSPPAPMPCSLAAPTALTPPFQPAQAVTPPTVRQVPSPQGAPVGRAMPVKASLKPWPSPRRAERLPRPRGKAPYAASVVL